jgi:PAS domain-containing protein
MRLEPSFASMLSAFDLAALDAVGDVVFAMDAQHRIRMVNAAWDAMARTNGALWGRGVWDLGACVLDATPPILRDYYLDLYARARRDGVAEHDYDCSSPALERRFRMRLHALPASSLLVVNNLVVERPHPSVPTASGGPHTVMCAHCRRVRVGDAWVWVPDWVAHIPPAMSHGLCPICLDYHYPSHGAGGPRPR